MRLSRRGCDVIRYIKSCFNEIMKKISVSNIIKKRILNYYQYKRCRRLLVATLISFKEEQFQENDSKFKSCIFSPGYGHFNKLIFYSCLFDLSNSKV